MPMAKMGGVFYGNNREYIFKEDEDEDDLY